MEYIEGETLAERLKKGALPLDKALEYGIQIADGLDNAHRAGIVHRDLKPGNAMLTKSGVKLFDFGLARLLDEAIDSATSDAPTKHKNLTDEHAIIGTLQYMAPEQLEGFAKAHQAGRSPGSEAGQHRHQRRRLCEDPRLWVGEACGASRGALPSALCELFLPPPER